MQVGLICEGHMAETLHASLIIQTPCMRNVNAQP